MLHGCGIALSSAILCSDAQIISWIPSSSSVSLAAPFFLPPIWTLAVNSIIICSMSPQFVHRMYYLLYKLRAMHPLLFSGDTTYTHASVFVSLLFFVVVFQWTEASASCTKCPDLSRTLSRTVKPHVNIPVVARDILYLVFDPRPSPF